MKALTLMQPWASAIAMGLKRFETRGFRPIYRGSLAIHAGKRIDEAAALRLMGHIPIADFPLGCVIAVCQLDQVLPVDQLKISDQERAFGDWRPGRFAWYLDNVQRLAEPIPARGYQHVWAVPPALRAKIRRQLV